MATIKHVITIMLKSGVSETATRTRMANAVKHVLDHLKELEWFTSYTVADDGGSGDTGGATLSIENYTPVISDSVFTIYDSGTDTEIPSTTATFELLGAYLFRGSNNIHEIQAFFRVNNPSDEDPVRFVFDFTLPTGLTHMNWNGTVNVDRSESSDRTIGEITSVGEVEYTAGKLRVKSEVTVYSPEALREFYISVKGILTTEAT